MLAGTPVEVKWHVTVDRTQGLAMDIVGLYPEAHPGDGVKNAIHMHTVTRDGQAAGHIDDIVPGPGMALKLPAI